VGRLCSAGTKHEMDVTSVFCATSKLEVTVFRWSLVVSSSRLPVWVRSGWLSGGPVADWRLRGETCGVGAQCRMPWSGERLGGPWHHVKPGAWLEVPSLVGGVQGVPSPRK
jgi:hypothetical protein